MAKEFFKDLPNTTTPLTASRLNGLLDGEEPMGNLVVDSIRTKNMFDVNSIIKGYVIASDGAINAAPGYCYCDYIKVKPSTTYTISLTNGNSGDPMRIAEYTSTKTFIDRPITSGNAPWTFTTPSNCEYIRLSYQYINSDILINTNLQLEEGSTATTYSEYQNLNPDVVDTGWVTATLSSYFTAYGTATTPQYRRIGKIVNIRGVVKPTSTISNTQIETTIFTLPEGFRISSGPEIEQLCQGSGSNKWLLTIKPNGVVAFSRYGISQYDSAANTVWLPFNVTYFID